MLSPSRQEGPRIRGGPRLRLLRLFPSATPFSVCYAFFRLLRSLSLRYASSSRTVEGRGA